VNIIEVENYLLEYSGDNKFLVKIKSEIEAGRSLPNEAMWGVFYCMLRDSAWAGRKVKARRYASKRRIQKIVKANSRSECRNKSRYF
jgi:hypothetical protein